MRSFLSAAALLAALSASSLALANGRADETTGVIRQVNAAAGTIMLNTSGATFHLPKNYLGAPLKIGEKVTLNWYDASGQKDVTGVKTW